MNRTNRLLLAALLALASAPAVASPQHPAGGPRGTNMLSLWLVLDPGPIGGAGAGGRFMLPIAPRGLLREPGLRDELTLEFGADFLHYDDRVGPAPYDVHYSWSGFLPVVGATWNFWLTPQLALYPKLDVGWWFGWYSGWSSYPGYSRADFDGAFLQGAVGLVYRLRTVALRVEAGSSLLRMGLGFQY